MFNDGATAKGHSDITTARRVYTHIRERQLDTAGAALGKFISDKTI